MHLKKNVPRQHSGSLGSGLICPIINVIICNISVIFFHAGIDYNLVMHNTLLQQLMQSIQRMTWGMQIETGAAAQAEAGNRGWKTTHNNETRIGLGIWKYDTL